MFKKTNIRFIIIGIALFLAGYTLYWTIAYHSFSDEKLEAMRTDGSIDKFEERIIRLGLDLQGGMHVVLELNVPKLVETLASNKTPQFDALMEKSIKEYKETGEDFFTVFRRNVEAEDFKLVRHFNDRGYKNAEIIASLQDESKDATSLQFSGPARTGSL